MNQKVDLNKLPPQKLLGYAQNLVKQEKSKPLPKSNESNLSQLNHLQNYHKYCHHPTKYLITPKKLYR